MKTGDSAVHIHQHWSGEWYVGCHQSDQFESVLVTSSYAALDTELADDTGATLEHWILHRSR